MEARELANKLYGRAYGDSFDDVLEEAKQSGLVIVTGASDDLMEFNGASQIDKARTERDRESKKYLRLWKAVRKEFGDEKAWELIEKAEE